MCVRVQVPSAKRRVIHNDVVPLFLFGCLDTSLECLPRKLVRWFDCVGDQLVRLCLFACLFAYLLIRLFVCLLACLFACLVAYLLAYLLVLSSATATLIQWQLPARLLVSRTHEGGPTRLRWRPCVLFCILTRARDVAPIPVDASAVRRTPSPKRARTRDTSGHTRRRRNPKHFVCHLWQCVAFVSVPL